MLTCKLFRCPVKVFCSKHCTEEKRMLLGLLTSLNRNDTVKIRIHSQIFKHIFRLKLLVSFLCVKYRY